MKYQVSFRAKTWYLHMWKYHRCYGFIINRSFHTKKTITVKWFGSSLVFILFTTQVQRGEAINNFVYLGGITD